MAVPQQRPQRVGWRAQVKPWILTVQDHQSMYSTDPRTAASANPASFPKIAFLVVVSRIIRFVAVWLVMDAIKPLPPT